MCIVFSNDLNKYINEKKFYNLSYLEHCKEDWISHYNYYTNKQCINQDRIDHRKKRLTMAVEQIDRIEHLIDLLNSDLDN
jgi:hypothetical protein